MLDYENQLFLDAVHENELFIFAKGILTELVLTNIFKAYTTETSLVFVLGASKGEENYFKEQLNNEKVYSITSEEYLANVRKEMYAHGGVFFITSRILVMDLLKEIFPIDKVTGIILLRAHNIVENSQEAFILRLYRTKNKEGFIKAFSQTPTGFLLGYGRLNRVMRCCFLANVSLWPRFHSVVKQSLTVADDPGLSNVVEIQLNLTEEMREIQSNLLDLVSWSVSELKRLVPALNDDEISAETALTQGFQKIVGAHMDAEWNTISNKAKELLNDLKVFRLLLTYLTKFDCVSFYSMLCNYTSSDMAFKSSWILSTSAEKIILAAKGRLLKKPGKSGSSDAAATNNKKTVFKPEVHPKWLAVSEILNDVFKQNDSKGEEQAAIDNDDTEAPMTSPDLKTLIFVDEPKTCSVLKDYLTDGSLEVLGKLVRDKDNLKIDLPQDLINKLNSKRRAEAAEPSAKRIKTAANIPDNEEEQEAGTSTTASKQGPKGVQITLTQITRKYETVDIFPSPVLIRSFQSTNEEEAYSISQTLLSIKPDVIVIFDPELELVRQIEIHRARMAAHQNIRVYFLAFRNSVEEQIYLTSIQREKVAFEKLIEEKATMVVPSEREAKDELNQDLWRDPSKASDITAGTQSMRNMEKASEERDIILVDIREFRSELPSLLHKRGLDLEPLTLDVGDYILTPDICVERKSISDLIGSLNHGRLYKQAEAMGRHYKKPILLIEQETIKNQAAAMYRRQNDLAQIMPKLQVLTIHFPNLRLIWSPGAHYTSEIFQELKKGKEQPSSEQALAIQKESIGDHISTKYNPITHNFLSKMPGLDSRNVYSILNRFQNLQELASATEKELEETLQNSHAASVLYAGIHSETLTSEAETGATSAGKPKSTLPVTKQKKPLFRIRAKAGK